VACFDEINQTKPMTAGRMFQISKQALRFCKVRRYAASDALVFLTIQDVGQPSGQRDRVLSDSELADVWRCTDSDDQQPYYSRLLKMLVLFGARTMEVRLSRWSEWDMDAWSGQFPKSTARAARRL
jgi:integrase